jgi:hypothetical protein
MENDLILQNAAEASDGMLPATTCSISSVDGKPKKRAKAATEEERKQRLKEDHKRYRDRNREKINARGQKYRLENSEKEKARAAKYHAENKEKRNATIAKWSANNREKCTDKNRRWRARNPGKSTEIAKRWQAANPEKVVENRKKTVVELKDNYVAACLGLPVSIARKYPDLMDSHREVITLKRKLNINQNRRNHEKSN